MHLAQCAEAEPWLLTDGGTHSHLDAPKHCDGFNAWLHYFLG
jgi:hypothetical protein